MSDRLFNYATASEKIRTLINNWTEARSDAEQRREARDLDVEVEELQRQGKLKSDETLIPIRVIDSNIKREKPAYLAFITQAKRVAIFKPVKDKTISVVELEKAFSEGMQYSGWEIPFFKVIDGGQLHGWDAIEVEYDETKPLNVGIDHVGNDNLLFPRKARKLESCERIARRYELSAYQLREFVKDYGFSLEQVDKIIGDCQDEEKLFEIYKVYFKSDKLVYISWYSKDGSDWIKPPEPLWLGRMTKEQVLSTKLVEQPVIDTSTGLSTVTQVEVPFNETVEKKVYESSYPIKLYTYDITEQPEVTKQKGRAFIDSPRQEAQTAIWSSFVNGVVRASNVYGSPATPGDNGSLKQIELKLEHGKFYNNPINFWHTDYPPIQVIDAANRLDVKNQEETGQTAYSVLTRKDTEKTATELNMAEKQSQLLSSVQVTLLATFVRDVYSYVWLLVQNYALNGQVQLGLVSPEVIGALYDLAAAGSVDVVERAEKMNQRMQMWATISNTPLATDFLVDILRETFPTDIHRYEEVLRKGDPKAVALRTILQLVQSVAIDENGQTRPEFKPYQEQLAQVVEQIGSLI
jgi:methionine-rich copper-binding protein CopC